MFEKNLTSDECVWRGMADQIRFYEEGGEPALGLCATGDHAHKDWQQYKECYAKAKEKIGLRQRLREIRGTKSHKLC